MTTNNHPAPPAEGAARTVTIQGRVPEIVPCQIADGIYGRGLKSGHDIYSKDGHWVHWSHMAEQALKFGCDADAQAFIDAHADKPDPLTVTLSADAVAKGERYAGKEINLHDTMDAVAWTNEFCRINPCADHAFMLGWFANAIMAGYDEAMRPVERAEVTVEWNVIQVDRRWNTYRSGVSVSLYRLSETDTRWEVLSSLGGTCDGFRANDLAAAKREALRIVREAVMAAAAAWEPLIEERQSQ